MVTKAVLCDRLHRAANDRNNWIQQCGVVSSRYETKQQVSSCFSKTLVYVCIKGQNGTGKTSKFSRLTILFQFFTLLCSSSYQADLRREERRKGGEGGRLGNPLLRQTLFLQSLTQRQTEERRRLLEHARQGADTAEC